MKTITPMQKLKYHRENLFNIFVESLWISYKEELNTHTEYDKQNFYYTIAQFNKTSSNFNWNLAGVDDDCVFRVESYLKKSFTTLGLSFKKKDDNHTCKIVFQNELLKNGINNNSNPLKIIPFAEIYTTQSMSISEMATMIKKFHKSYLLTMADTQPNHQDLLNFIINEFAMEPLPLKNIKSGIKKRLTTTNITNFHPT